MGHLEQTLSNPKAFDTLRLDDETFEQVARLKLKKNLSHIELCRLAQYYLYKEDIKAALDTVKRAKQLKGSSLAQAIYLASLAAKEDFQTLAQAMRPISVQGQSPLDLEGYSFEYESLAAYYAIYLKDYREAMAFLYRAESLAAALNLTYRLTAIRSNLRYCATMLGERLTLNPLVSDANNKAARSTVRGIFNNALKQQNLSAVKTLALEGKIDKADIILAESTHAYALALENQQSFSEAARLLNLNIPEHPISRLYWSFLTLQLFAMLGPNRGLANPEKAAEVCLNVLDTSRFFTSHLGLAAHLYPLGILLAAEFDERLLPHTHEAVVLWNETYRDGLHRQGKRLVTVTKPIREAIILDELYARFEHLSKSFTKPLGHPQNRARYQESLTKAKLGRSNFTSVGGLYRGYVYLSDGLSQKATKDKADELYESSSFLQTILKPKSAELLL